MNIRPLGDRVLIERVEADSKTKGGIIIPDTAKEKPKEGKVVSLGTGKTLNDGKKSKFSIKKGNLVLFSSYAGTDVKLNGKEYLIVSEEDILAVITKEGET